MLGNREATAFFKYQAFTVARITNQEILDGLQKTLEVALQNGIGFDQWKKSAVALLETHKTVLPDYRLRTIYKTNTSLAYAGAQIAALEQSKDDFPMWEFKAVMDAKTRQEHRVLNGKIFENGDWTYFPPVGFNCRCRARIISKSKAASLKPSTVTDTEKTQLKNTNFIKNKNAAFARWVEEKKKNLPKPLKEAIDNRERKLIAELGFAPKNFIQKKYLELSKDPNYIEISSTKETFLFQHIRAHKKDLKENLAVAEVLSRNGYSVVIAEHNLVNQRKNPEYVIYEKNGLVFLSDRKTPTKPSGIRGRFEAVKNQNISHLVIVIDPNWNVSDVADGLIKGFKFNKSILKCVVVRKKNAVEVSRESYESGIILKKIESLYREER